MEQEEILKQKLEKLSKCKGLKKEDLQGKYRKAFMQLKYEIKNCAMDILYEIALGNLRWHEIDYIAAAKEVNAFIEEPAGKTIMQNISHALYRQCSFEAFRIECLKMREQVKHIFWKYAPKDWDSIELK